MKQTAVEWFYQRILSKDIKQVFEQAKAMEKEQIIQSYSYGWHDGQEVIIKRIEYIDIGGDDGGKQYYNETFKSE